MFKYLIQSFFLCLLPNFFSDAKILIFTYAYNYPHFIDIHNKTLKKFLKDDYELMVFNDAPNAQMAAKIKKMCDACNIECVRIPQEIHDMPYLERPASGLFARYHNPSVRHCNAIQYSLDNFGFKHDDILVIIDGDLFLTKNFSIREYLQDYHIAAFLRPCCDVIGSSCQKNHKAPNIKYLWVGLLMLDMKNLPNKETLNVNCGQIDDITVDSGGYTYYYLKANTHVKIKSIQRHRLREIICQSCKKNKKLFCNHNTNYLQKLGFDPAVRELAQSLPIAHHKTGGNTEFFLNNYFIHYGGVTNYSKLSEKFIINKENIFNRFIERILNQGKQ